MKISGKKWSIKKMASTGVSKLRFMTKARESLGETADSDAPDVDPGLWSVSTFDSAMLYKDPSMDQKLISIKVMARRSYGGANPYVEQQMLALEKPKRKRKLDK